MKQQQENQNEIQTVCSASKTRREKYSRFIKPATLIGTSLAVALLAVLQIYALMFMLERPCKAWFDDEFYYDTVLFFALLIPAPFFLVRGVWDAWTVLDESEKLSTAVWTLFLRGLADGIVAMWMIALMAAFPFIIAFLIHIAKGIVEHI